MQQVEFYIPQTPGTSTPMIKVPEPDNWQSLMIELSFESGSQLGTLNASKLIWKGTNAEYLNNYIINGLIPGGIGIFEGVPLQIKVCKTQEIVFNGIIDLTDSETTFACDILQCKIRDNQIDMVSQLMDSISYGFLATPIINGGGGIINPTPINNGGDYVVIPYQRNDVPDTIQFFTTGLAIYNVAEKTYQIGNTLTGIIASAFAASASLSVGATISAVIQLVYYILYIVLMVLVIIAMMKSAFNYLCSPLMTKFGMYAHTLIEKACTYFNIGFSSTIFQNAPYNRLVIMPTKQAWINNQSFTRTLFNNIVGGSSITNRMEYDDLFNQQNGGLAYGYWDGTCGDFIRAMEDVFNAKAKIILTVTGQKVLHFERWDYIYNLANYQLPNISGEVPFNSHGILNNTGFSQSAFKTNAWEVPSNYMVRYSMDEQDVNTYNYYDGTMCYCTTRPININVKNNIVLQNLTEKNLRFAQAFRKDKLTSTEEALIPLWTAASLLTNAIITISSGINTVINAVSGLWNSPPLPTISNGGYTFMPSLPAFYNSGHLLLSGDVTGIPKMFIAGYPQNYNNFFDFHSHSFTGVTIDITNKSIIGARYLMKNFHFSNLPQTVVPNSPYNQPYVVGANYSNQWLLCQGQKIPLCCEEYDLIKNNNIIKTFTGQFARVDSLKWSIFKGMADIDYRIQKQYSKNLKTSFVIDGVETTSVL